MKVEVRETRSRRTRAPLSGPCLWTEPEKMTQSACVLVVLLSARLVSGVYPQARNVTWKSTNFKALLTWEPEPSADYSYTVEFSEVGSNRQRTQHCTYSRATTCDLSASLTDPTACYTADVLSTPPLGATSDLTEFPHTAAPRFCPYKDTDIGKPEFKVEGNEDKRSVTLYVSDPLTSLFKDGRQLTIRDVFSDELQYRVTYRKNKSSGKKVHDSKSSEVHLTGLDQGESYCFNVQAWIPKREAKQLGEVSQTKCFNNDDQSVFKVYSPVVIACAVLFILLVAGVIVAVTVVCVRRRRKTLKSGRESAPLRGV